jgi:hypothetical protein
VFHRIFDPGGRKSGDGNEAILTDGERIVSAVAQVLLADQQVSEGHQVDHSWIFDGIGKGLGKLAVKPYAFADDLGQLPPLGEAFADDHVIHADDGALDIGDVASEEVGGFDNPGETLGEDGVQRDLAEIVKQSADESFGRSETGVAAMGGFDRFAQKLGAAGYGERMLPKLRAGKLRLSLAGTGKSFEDRDGQDGAAKGFETKENDGPLQGYGFGVNAGIGAMNELKDSSGEGGVAADEGDNLGDRSLFIGGDLQNPNGDRGQCGKLLELLEDQLDAAGLKMVGGMHGLMLLERERGELRSGR